MNTKNKTRNFRTITTIAATATIAAALGGCIDDQERELDEGDRAIITAATATIITDQAKDMLQSIVLGEVEGRLSEFFFPAGASTVNLSADSLAEIDTIVTNAIEASVWSEHSDKLESAISFISGYKRTECLGDPCSEYQEALQSEGYIYTHAGQIDLGWTFYKGQTEADKQLSAIPQMLILAPIRMMLNQEIVELKFLRNANITNDVEILMDTACDYRDDLEEFEATFEERQAQYGPVVLSSSGSYVNCYEDGDERTECSEKQTYCYSTPRDGANSSGETCRTRHRDYTVGFEYLSEWDHPNLKSDMQDERDDLMQEDYEVILGGDDFSAVVSSLSALCTDPPIPVGADIDVPEADYADECDTLTVSSDQFAAFDQPATEHPFRKSDETFNGAPVYVNDVVEHKTYKIFLRKIVDNTHIENSDFRWYLVWGEGDPSNEASNSVDFSEAMRGKSPWAAAWTKSTISCADAE